jgi:trimethylamine:corrinoid methyltransferase-like protein
MSQQSASQDAPVVTDTPTISQLEQQHSDALLALSYTTASVSRNNNGIAFAPPEALQLIDELAAEVGEARLKLDRLREETRRLAESAVDLCPACGEPAGKHNVGFVPTIIQCQSRGPRR